MSADDIRETGDREETVVPARIAKGDVIEDTVGKRWMKVTEVRIMSDSGPGVFSFYSGGPDDRLTFEGTELVTRKARPSSCTAVTGDGRG